VRGSFNPEMLILARESRELTQSELAERALVKQPAVSKCESGLLLPSEELLSAFAGALDYPTNLFVQQDPVYGFNSTVFFHRKRKGLSERILRRLHALMNLTRMRLDRLKRAVDRPITPGFKQFELAEFENPSAIAKLVRSTWLLPPGPIRNVTEAIEHAGGMVVFSDFGTRQIDAISEWVPGSMPLFLVNSNLSIPWDRVRLTLSHELAHVLMHTFPSQTMEEEANEFAAEFLMPRKEIKPYLYNLTLAKLQDLKRHWKVSMQALIERAYNLSTITEYQRRLFYINLGKRSNIVHEPLEHEFQIEKPQTVNSLIRIHKNELSYSDSELCELLFMKEADLRSEMYGERILKLVNF
jgi:Zn-dependent peptidase ImmA (M78 family)/DNA-binding XRE family transcriptional regulator